MSRARCSPVTIAFSANAERSLRSGCATTASITSSGRARQAIMFQAALASSHSSLIKTSAGAAGFRAIAVMVSR
ncbi:hypothetical protein ABZ359_36855 [Streptomyces sp. NPDC005968]|uniref:hypothetical protein n=1 Tax=Streptomyces sp. NPDC005968 TaxID=3154574 RepID=UPI0033D83082